MTRRVRVIPILLLTNDGLVKTQRFRRPRYLGDPINVVKIFNDKQVDELVLLDIEATTANRINYQRVEEIVSEAFMPIAYGGGISSVEACAGLFRCGVEKVVINSALATDISLITRLAERFGSQAVVASIDVGSKLLRRNQVLFRNGRLAINATPAEHAVACARMGAGELLVTAIEREGTFQGYDIELLRSVAEAVDVPVIANGGARGIDDFIAAVRDGKCSAVAASSIFVFAGKKEGVLINYPTEQELEASFWSRVP